MYVCVYFCHSFFFSFLSSLSLYPSLCIYHAFSLSPFLHPTLSLPPSLRLHLHASHILSPSRCQNAFISQYVLSQCILPPGHQRKLKLSRPKLLFSGGLYKALFQDVNNAISSSSGEKLRTSITPFRPQRVNMKFSL